MKQKSLEYMLSYALALIQTDPKARVIFAATDGRRARFVFDEARRLLQTMKVDKFPAHFNSREIRMEGGGQLLVLQMDGDVADYSGFQCTHLWLDEFMPPAARAYMPSRVRSASYHEEPVGVYDAYGVTRRVDY